MIEDVSFARKACCIFYQGTRVKVLHALCMCAHTYVFGIFFGPSKCFFHRICDSETTVHVSQRGAFLCPHHPAHKSAILQPCEAPIDSKRTHHEFVAGYCIVDSREAKQASVERDDNWFVGLHTIRLEGTRGQQTHTVHTYIMG